MYNDILKMVRELPTFQLTFNVKHCIDFGYRRIPKTNTDVHLLLELGILESVECEPETMLRNMKFDDDTCKQKFIDEHYWLKVTQAGLLAYAILMEREAVHNHCVQVLKDEHMDYKLRLLDKFSDMLELSDSVTIKPIAD